MSGMRPIGVGTQGGGAQGPQGAQGTQGLTGTTGPQGSAGPQGVQGSQGFQGDIGPQGVQGFQGSTGAQGAQGATGSQGAQGFQGAQGAQGFQGNQGFQGFQGNQGAQGFQGVSGSQGAPAPTSSEFVLGAADGALPNGIVIPGLAGSADIAGIGGGGITEEWDTNTTGLTWTSAPTVEDSDTTRKSHLYVQDNISGTIFGYRSWSPAGAFDARLRIAGIGADSASAYVDVGLLIADDTTPTTGALILWSLDRSGNFHRVSSFTYSAGSPTQRGSNFEGFDNGIVLRITRDGSNNLSFWLSGDGYGWILQATQALTFTVANIGIRSFGSTTDVKHLYLDWLRTDV